MGKTDPINGEDGPPSPFQARCSCSVEYRPFHCTMIKAIPCPIHNGHPPPPPYRLAFQAVARSQTCPCRVRLTPNLGMITNDRRVGSGTERYDDIEGFRAGGRVLQGTGVQWLRFASLASGYGQHPLQQPLQERGQIAGPSCPTWPLFI